MGGSADTVAVRPLDAAAVTSPRASAAGSGGNAWLRGAKLLVAILLLPACLGFTQGFSAHFLHLGAKVRVQMLGWPVEVQWLGWGILAFTIFAALLWRPLMPYLFAHELVHALATWLCLGRVSNLRVSATGGQVTTSKSNTFIRLAPYFIPLYTLLAAGIFLALDAWWRPLGDYRWILAGVLGFTLAYHVAYTVWSLRRDQPDLRPDGWLFSIVVIYLGNLAVIAAVLGLTLAGSARGCGEHVAGVATLGWEQSGLVYRELYATLERWLQK